MSNESVGQNVAHGYPPQQGGTYPPQQGGTYPQYQGGYASQPVGYPPSQYPPQQGVYAPSQYPSQQGGYAPSQYPPQQGGYAPSQYPPQMGGYPPSQYPAQQSGHATQHGGGPQNPSTCAEPQPFPAYGPPSQGGYHDGSTSLPSVDLKLEDGPAMLDEDLPPSIRHGFIRKVYAILSIQLLVTFGLALMVNLWTPAGEFLIENWWIGIIGAVVAIVLLLILFCVPNVARWSPLNFFLLSIMTLAYSTTVAYAGARASTFAFTIAFGITVSVVLSLTVFAIQTKWDFTGIGPYLLVASVVLLIFGILAMIFRNNILTMVYSSIGALVMSLYIVHDTQQIVGGKHRKTEFSIDDYILAAVSLYLDIILLFTYILNIVSGVTSQ